MLLADFISAVNDGTVCSTMLKELPPEDRREAGMLFQATRKPKAAPVEKVVKKRIVLWSHDRVPFNYGSVMYEDGLVIHGDWGQSVLITGDNLKMKVL
jgi:hypothetical protein